MSRYLTLFAMVFAVSFCGCNGGGIPVNFVEGTVTLDGTPLEDAVVSFSPVAGGTGKAAVGMTNKQGKFKLTAADSTKVGGGTAVGEYLVAITKPPKAAMVDPNAWKTDPDYGKDNKDDHTNATVIKFDVPEGYWVADTSGLTASVKSGNNTGLKFELKKEFVPIKK